MREKDRVAIIILNYNSFHDTVNLIKSIIEKENLVNYDIIVVDNSENKDEQERIKGLHGCNTILLNSNNGYANGNNHGICYAIKNNYKFILIANSDTELIEENSIGRLITAMNRYNVHVIGPRLVDKDNKTRSGAGKLNCYGKVKEIKTEIPSICQGLIGAFFIFKSQIVKKVGLMNENFFLYLEETDYFYKMYKKGYKIMYYPLVTVKHYGGATTSKVYDYYISRNRFIITKENFKTSRLLLTVILLAEYMCTDIKQWIACKYGIRKYDFRQRKKMRWIGFLDGFKGVEGKRDFKN